jgi:hypothetical protein
MMPAAQYTSGALSCHQSAQVGRRVLQSTGPSADQPGDAASLSITAVEKHPQQTATALAGTGTFDEVPKAK